MAIAVLVVALQVVVMTDILDIVHVRDRSTMKLR